MKIVISWFFQNFRNFSFSGLHTAHLPQWPTLLIELVPEKLFQFVYCSDLCLNNSHFRKQSAPQATPAIISLFKLFKRFYSYWVNRWPIKYKLNSKTSMFSLKNLNGIGLVSNTLWTIFPQTSPSMPVVINPSSF